MGYNGCQNYFSPKQMAYMHYKLNTIYSSFCSVTPTSPYCITEPMVTTEIPSFSTAIYNQTHIMPGDIIVRANATLKITGCVYMPWTSKIYVMQGGKLIVDGGTITSVCPNRMWGGIEVRGTSGAIQVYGTPNNTDFDPNQGVCEVINNSIIIGARIGIYAGSNTNYFSIPNPQIENKYTGGIIRVDNSTIKDCYIGVAFAQYGKMRKSTLSYIKNSTFSSEILKEPFFYQNGVDVPMQYGIYLSSIDKVPIHNNDFEQITSMVSLGNSNFNTINQNIRGVAIFAFNSTLNLEKNRINNYRFGIRATNNYSIVRTALIRKNQFFNNMYGITGNISYSTIDSNSFTIPQGLIDTVNIPLGSSKYPYGIYLDNSHTFKLECDSFKTFFDNGGGTGGQVGIQTYYLTSPPPLSSYGLIVKNSGNIGGEVKGNCYFGGLNIATQTEQNNPNLQIRCNKYENNTLAWRVNPLSVTGVLGNQGTSCITTSNAQYRANNTFLGCADNKDQFESYLSIPFNYFYWDNNLTGSDIVLKPCTTSVNNAVSLNPCNSSSNDPNACPTAPVNLVQLKEIREKTMDYILADQEQQALEYLITNASIDEVKRLLVAYYYGKEDVQGMQQYINQLPMSNEESKQFRILYTLLRILKVQNKELIDLKPGQIKQLEDIAETPTRAGSEARSLLDHIGKKDDNINPEVPYTAISLARLVKPSTEPIIKEREAELGQNIPNPTSNATVINIYVPEKSTSANFIILNSFGQTMFEKTLAKGEQQINISTSIFENGIYFYTMYVDNKPIASKRIVIVK